MSDDLDRNVPGRDPVAAEACRRFKDSAEFLDPQRRAILAAKNFRAGNQWPQEIKDQRMGAPALQGVAAQPARPCLTIDRVSQPVRQVSNAVRQSNFEIDCIPVGDGADKSTAEIFKGWMRKVQNDARADAPVEWAADGAAEGGLAWFRLVAFETNTDEQHPFDQDLRMERVTNSLSVYPDPHAQKPTRSDMRYLLQTEDLPREEAIARYNLQPSDLATLNEFMATGDNGGWVTENTIRTAEYWRVDHVDIRIVELWNGTVYRGKAIPKGLEKGDETDPESIRRERIYREPHVKWSKVTATKEIEKTDWLGSRIPYIPILGEELNVDGKPVLRGVIEPAMDAQRMINYTFSAAIESAALAPKSPWLVAEGQTDAFRNQWQTSATTNWAVLNYTPVSLLGQPVPPPTRNSVEQPIQAMVELMVRSEEAVKSTTGIFDPSLGNTNPREKSGTAIKALQDQSAFGQSNYQDNVARALVYAGELMVELGPKLLDRVGRVIQILGQDKTTTAVMLGQPYVPSTTQNGTPQPLMGPNGQQVTSATDAFAVQQLKDGIAKFYDLKAGKYSVECVVGRREITKRQESAAALGELLPHLPPPMQAVLAPEYIETLDFRDSAKIAKIARRSLPPQLQQAEDGPPPIPPEVQQQMQQMGQALQEAKQIIDTDKVKNDAMIQKTKMEKTAEVIIHQMDNSAKILVAHITAAKEGATTAVEGQLEERATGLQLAHEAYQADVQRAHEFRMAQQDHANAIEAASHTNDLAIQQQAAAPPEQAGA